MPTTLHENRFSTGIGVVEVQKLEDFGDFSHARVTDPLRGSAWRESGCKNSRIFARFRELSHGSRACSRDRRVAGSILPWSAGRRVTCAELSCREQLAQTNLHRPVCAERLA